ncbi:DUF6480 family protein [Cellulomonas xiejunii]|uniref:DUF6480 family protein n=1 Tax=Cellulomonas xiejunii TaxID=2968083 RepID=A0ABY5KV73_9CELL|nr:DUF6480 family protein [Cellulomonas xiejunii]MCC2315122.1 DUF6480 family protein [Cellulomonas xiejunii]MCC2315673.1 DUF6480 family protein [Cellulomonas xiejunii]MCC2321736.1 DUF6480 family protein [Cellulomonas xiejunii]UUI73045.1 DUF6480 family protein [Cellulomonas xiejunii]
MSQPTSPDPDPANTPGLEPGGGVAPGDTPPGESSTSGASDRQPRTGSRGANWMAYVVIGLVVVFAALFFVGYAIGLAD